MNILFVLSLIYLLVMFLIYKKTNKKLCIISAIFYSLALMLCYNTFIVFLLYMLGIRGSMLIYSIINLVVGTGILFVIHKNEFKIQKYFFDKKKLAVFLCLGIIIFLIGYFRFRGFDAISFESGDSAIHYRHALEFSEDLSILDRSNTNDEVFGSFVRVMPISYINCGFLFNIFSSFKTYTVFFIYNVAFLILSSFVFLITVIDIFKYKKKDYIFALVLTLFYILAFPFNSFIMGFCYLSLAILVVNLLYLTIFYFKDNFDKHIFFKLIVIFLSTFSIFFSYYLFVPAVYLALGLYYIFLWKKKKMKFSKMVIYGVVTLIIPFVIGFIYFLVTLFIDSGVGTIINLIGLYGYTYDNLTPMYLFLFVTFYLGCLLYKKEKLDYLKLNFYIITGVIFVFLILYAVKVADLYYFYKLFYIYWLLLVLFFVKKMSLYRKKIYIALAVFSVINAVVYFTPTNKLSSFIVETNVYTWNVSMLRDDKILFDSNELELVEESLKYKNICVQDDKFLLLGNRLKNIWFSAITYTVPVLGNVDGNVTEVYINNPYDLGHWKYMLNFDCLVYYYEDKDVVLDGDGYDILFENEAGAIIRKKSKSY